MILPFFLTALSNHLQPMVQSANKSVISLHLSLIEKLGYRELEEITEEDRWSLRKDYLHRWSSHCDAYCSAKYSCMGLGICYHGNRIEPLKKTICDGKTYYK